MERECYVGQHTWGVGFESIIGALDQDGHFWGVRCSSQLSYRKNGELSYSVMERCLHLRGSRKVYITSMRNKALAEFGT